MDAMGATEEDCTTNTKNKKRKQKKKKKERKRRKQQVERERKRNIENWKKNWEREKFDYCSALSFQTRKLQPKFKQSITITFTLLKFGCRYSNHFQLYFGASSYVQIIQKLFFWGQFGSTANIKLITKS